MDQTLGLVALVVRDYEEALDFFVGKLGFRLVEDRPVPEQAKRWVVVSPPGEGGAKLLLARASGTEQESRIGNQTGGRVFLFLYTDDFWRDYRNYVSKGIAFVRDPRSEETKRSSTAGQGAGPAGRWWSSGFSLRPGGTSARRGCAVDLEAHLLKFTVRV
jgi:catechol 2,3-dioxygenase-like lactoylglutathione lyase family enzyme